MGFSWQCTPDVSRSDCSYCLKENVGYFYRCCHKKQGGFVRRPSCIFRWNLYPFYNSTTADPPAPSPPGSTNTTSINGPKPPSPSLLASENLSVRALMKLKSYCKDSMVLISSAASTKELVKDNTKKKAQNHLVQAY
ncbi:cysteine-rich receptor-like protein kinase 11 isoform X1 [Tripterygium wilfordii]|uniref:cysteine-rich receptor-like protein kinase 11 isoform X1 n=1 Tax=Tripterygium wilfordii TaxID=458696 RepID=UPI0018F825F9|nr:cysteine-rich receptor-like protein kinase 11 isoform X1 [Tripterygium wilfordii]